MPASEQPIYPTPKSKDQTESGSELAPNFGADGLITAIVQAADSGEILMLAHMNDLALQRTIDSGEAHFWSRSRQELWHKGATSGDILEVREIRIDCDQDAVLLRVIPKGTGACHTGRKTCFYRKIGSDGRRLEFIAETNDATR